MHLLLIGLLAAVLFGLTKAVIFGVIALVALVATAVSVDLAPIINQVVIPLLVPILIAGFTAVAYRVQQFFHLHVLDGRRAVLETAIGNGIALATAKLGGPLNVNVPSNVAAVVEYAKTTVPGAIAKLGVDPKALGQKVAAEIAKAAGTPAS